MLLLILRTITIMRAMDMRRVYQTSASCGATARSSFRTLRGEVKAELKEVFAILADGAEEEAEMRTEKMPESAINKNWLPVQDVTRTRLSCLTEREATAVQRFVLLVA